MPAAVMVGCYEPGLAVLLLFVPFSSAGMGGDWARLVIYSAALPSELHPPFGFISR